MSLLAGLFTNPMTLPFDTLWAVIPVSLAVAIVYKTLRTKTLRRLPWDITKLTVYILASIAALMVGFYVVFVYLPAR